MSKQGQVTEHFKATKPARKNCMHKVKKILTTVNLINSEPISAEEESDQEHKQEGNPHDTFE